MIINAYDRPGQPGRGFEHVAEISCSFAGSEFRLGNSLVRHAAIVLANRPEFHNIMP